MWNKRLVTLNQAVILKRLGFHEQVNHYGWGENKHPFCCSGVCSDWNECNNFISLPTVDEALEWLHTRCKLNYVSTYSSDANKEHQITICYEDGSVVFCYSPNKYAVKRKAISTLIRYYENRNKKSNKSSKRKSR